MSASKLGTIGKIRPLVFAVASNGVKITNHLYQGIAGFKVVDVSATDPLTNRLVNPQTIHACWPAKYSLGRETTSMRANHINPACNWWDDCYT